MEGRRYEYEEQTLRTRVCTFVDNDVYGLLLSNLVSSDSSVYIFLLSKRLDSCEFHYEFKKKT